MIFVNDVKRLYVHEPFGKYFSEERWLYYESKEEVEFMMTWLNPNGIRE